MLKPILLSSLLMTATLALALPAPVHADGDACEAATWDLVAEIEESRANGGPSTGLGPAIAHVTESCTGSHRSNDGNHDILARPPPEFDPRRPLAEEQIPSWEAYGLGALENNALMTCKEGRVDSIPDAANFHLVLGVADSTGVLHGFNWTTSTDRRGSAWFEFTAHSSREHYDGVSEEVGLVVDGDPFSKWGQVILFPNAPYEQRFNSDARDLGGSCDPMKPPCSGWAWATAIDPPLVIKVESDFSNCRQ